MKKLSAGIIAIVLCSAYMAVSQENPQTGSSTSTGATGSSQTTSQTGSSGQSTTTGQTGTPGQSAQQPESSGETQVLIDPGKIYNAERPTEWIGKSVQLQNVLVTDTNDSGNFWVGVGGKQRLLVTKNQDDPNQKALEVKRGDVVTVSGMVQPATDEWAQKAREEQGSMRDAMNSSGVFLYAASVSIASSTAK